MISTLAEVLYYLLEFFIWLLIAQAITENMTLVSNERLFDGFGVKRLW